MRQLSTVRILLGGAVQGAAAGSLLIGLMLAADVASLRTLIGAGGGAAPALLLLASAAMLFAICAAASSLAWNEDETLHRAAVPIPSRPRRPPAS